MRLTSSCFDDNGPIRAECAFCRPDPATHAALSQNLNPDFTWGGLPLDAKSLVLICHDPDVPSVPDDVNQEGRTVPKDLARVDFFHWVLVDLPPDTAMIQKGEFSSGVTARGKPVPQGPHGTRQGLNSYTQWFAGDPDMEGNYFGYDGPCPPWNDERPHRYVFTLYALNVARCPVEGNFTGPQVQNTIRGHILDQASLTGIYSLNPAVRFG